MKFIEKHFGIVFAITFALGLFVPTGSHFLQLLIVPLLIVILYLSFLSIKTKHFLSHLKSPGLLLILLLLYLLIVPAVVYLLVSLHDRTLAIGLMFIAAAPTGVAAPALTKIVKGNDSLTLIFTVLTHFLVPFTLVTLFWMFTKYQIQLDLFEIFKTLLIFVFIPFLLASITKHFGQNFIKKTKDYYRLATILLIALMLYIVIGQQSALILQNPELSFKYLLWVYGLFVVLSLIGYFVPFWKSKKDRISYTISNTFINAALIIVVAHEFLPPEIVLIVVLTEVPYSTYLGPLSYLMKKLP